MPPHIGWPLVQPPEEQKPLMQDCPVAQQVPPHIGWPLVQPAGTQLELAHSRLAQRLPQKPQLFASKVVSVQTPLHIDCEPGQPLIMQLLFTQLWPVGQTLPHTPQLLGSRDVRVHTPLHISWPAMPQPPVVMSVEPPSSLG